MNQIHEIDLVDRTVTVGPGINMLKLNEELRPHGVFYPDDPASLPVLARRRADRHRRLVAARRALRPHARPRDLDGGRAADRRDRRDRRGRRAQAAQVLAPASRSSSCSRATRARSGSRPRRRSSSSPRPEVEFAAFFAFDDYMKAYETTGAARPGRGLATLAGVVLFDEWKIALPAPRRRGLHPAARRPCKAVVRGRDVRHAGRGRAGQQADDGAGAQRGRHATSATRSPPATGRRATTATRRRCTAATSDGQAVLMCWHCEDAALNYSVLPAGARGVARDRRPLPRALRHLRRLGHVRLHERPAQAVGATTWSRSTSASGSRSSTTRTGRRG